MTDLLALAIVAGMVLFGRKRGFLGMAFLAGGLLGGYVAALLLFRPAGGLLGAITGLPGIVTYPLGGTLVLVLVSSVVGRLARRHRRERDFKIEEGWEPPPNDEIGGMVLGGVYGVAIALLVSWAGMSLAGLYGGRDLASVRDSLTGRLSSGAVQRTVAAGARSIVGDRFVASSVGHMVADPYRAIQGLNGVMADERMQSLLSGGVIQEAARVQDPRLLARDPSLVALANDETFSSAMRTFGLAGSGSGPVEPEEIADAIVREAGPALRSVDALVNDPEVSDILASPDFRETWERGDFMRLATGAEFGRLFDRVLQELRRNR